MGELPKSKDDSEKPVVSLNYDPRGNLKERIEPDGGKTTYTYYPHNLVKTETVVGKDKDGNEKNYTTSYEYDNTGNQTKIIDPDNNETIKEYDDLNRIAKISYPAGNEEEFEYDKRGNKSAYEDGKDNRTEYIYDAYGRLSKVTDAKLNYTEYMYDRMGNLTLNGNRLGHETEYAYDELNRLIREEDSLGHVTEYAYDAVGNREYKRDPNGTESSYDYYDNYLVKEISLTNGERSHSISYKYDEAGFQKEVVDGDITSRYNTYNGTYTPDPYGRVYKKTDIIDGQSLSTEYRYDIMGRAIGIKTPRGEWVEYDYNNIGELTAVPGYVTDTSYNSRGMLEYVTAANGIVNSYAYDMNGRVTDLSYKNQSTTLKDYSLQYDNTNNIIAKNDNGYNYDRLNQLVFANLKGKFELTSNTKKDDQYTGRAIDDYQGQEVLEEVENTEIIELDYAAGSIGVDLGGTFPLTKVELSAESPLHRVEERDLEVYYSTNSYEYTEITGFELTKDEDGKIWINLDEAVEARYIKVKTYYDDRDQNFEPVNNAEFSNTAGDIIKVYYYVTERLEQYDYDAGGNRLSSTISDRYTDTKTYEYYSNSIRLKSNGKYAYIYDDNGNLLKKGTGYTISGDSVTINPDGEEYWEYEYDLLDRLTKVEKNGTTIANYVYNHKGLRVKKENYDTTEYYVFGLADNVLYEQENGEYSEYIYVGGQHLARVDGQLLSTETTTYFYHTDHLGSTVLVTNSSADIVWSSEYTPFGSITMEEGEFGFQKVKKFTGKDLDEDTGLYYYNARWYDAEIGRFTSADTYKGELENPQTLNLYIYTANNPLVYVDPTGHDAIGPIGANLLIEEHENYTPYEIDRRKINQEYLEYKNSVVKPYLKDTAKMMVFGDYSDKATKAGVAGQVLLDFTGVDILADARDFSASIENRDYLGTALNGIGLIPIIGMVQNFKYLRHAENLSELKHLDNVKTGRKIVDSALDPYEGIKKASKYLKSQDVPREFRKQILESFERKTIYMDFAGENSYALRYHDFGVKANVKGRYLFETFQPLSNRKGTAILWDWNDMTGVKQWKIRPNTPIIKGKAAPQLNFGSEYIGGIEQWYVNDLMEP